ncbi:MAG TPA: response regulator [Terriglobales bacterium]|nr:response regulator [Terriglobales bacterium]
MSGQDRAKLLVVDDEQLVADSLAAISRSKGYLVTARYRAGDGIAAAQSVRPCLLLSDVMMPDLNGIQLAIQVRNLVPECKVLLMSGDPHAAILVAQARERGHAFEFLDKLVDPTSFWHRRRDSLKCIRAGRTKVATTTGRPTFFANAGSSVR